MNTKTKDALVDLLQKLQVVTIAANFKGTPDLVRACSDAIFALNNDETVIETGTGESK